MTGDVRRAHNPPRPMTDNKIDETEMSGRRPDHDMPQEDSAKLQKQSAPHSLDYDGLKNDMSDNVAPIMLPAECVSIEM